MKPTSAFAAATLAAALGVPLAVPAFFIPQSPVAVEFLNAHTGHYVLLRDPQEIAAVEAGAAGPGWKRTGFGFTVKDPGTAVVEGNACRFYAPAINTHFHTANADECAALRANGFGWIFEKFDFAALPAAGGVCQEGVPVWRLYNNGHSRGDPNHRYTPFADVRDEMVSKGWMVETVAFCTHEPRRTGSKAFPVLALKVLPTAECEDESINLGACVALNQLPRLANRVQAFLPPFFIAPNPDFPTGLEEVTGLRTHDVYTAQSARDPAAIAAHSFVQADGSGSATMGIHVNSADRTVGDASSINPLYQFTTRAPGHGQPDARVFPWGDGRDNHVEVAFRLSVRTLVRGDGHSYGHPTLQFVDRSSGEHLYVTLGAYGSNPVGEEDFMGRDVGTGRVIVSTTFRADPSFGKRLSGEWIHCPGEGACLPAATDEFRFRIDLAAFRTVLARARTLSPGLSGAPSDYFLANFHFNNEVWRNGRIGLVLSGYELKIFER